MLDEGIKFGSNGGGEETLARRKLPTLKDGVIGSTCKATVAVVSCLGAVVLIQHCVVLPTTTTTLRSQY